MAQKPGDTATQIDRMTRRIVRNLREIPFERNAVKILKERAIQASADYIENHLSTAMLFPQKAQLWDFAASQITLHDQLHLEFGVYTGGSINHFSKYLPAAQFYGFDSFEGLKEDWTGYHLTKGHFDLAGKLPKVNSNVELIPGWFDETVPSFLKQHDGRKVGFLHIDCDTYTSSKLVLDLLESDITVGTVIVFDEYHGYPNWKNGEFLAWQEWVKSNKVEYRYLAFSAMQSAVVITKLKNAR